MKSRVYLDTVLNLGATPSSQPSPPTGMCVKLSVFPLYDRFFWNHTAQNEGVFIIH